MAQKKIERGWCAVSFFDWRCVALVTHRQVRQETGETSTIPSFHSSIIHLPPFSISSFSGTLVVLSWPAWLFWLFVLPGWCRCIFLGIGTNCGLRNKIFCSFNLRPWHNTYLSKCLSSQTMLSLSGVQGWKVHAVSMERKTLQQRSPYHSCLNR